MRLGIFGGTFDPPHLGHLILAGEALDQLKLDRLLWVLTPNPPHKQGQNVGPLAQRLELVRAAIQYDPYFELCTVDIDRPAPHYAADTVRLLRQQYPVDDLVYLIGGDSLHDLPDWHAPREFVDNCTGIGVMRRPGDRVDMARLEKALPGVGAKICFIESPLLEISSNQIRERIQQGRPYRYYLLDAVFQIIHQKSYYIQA